MIKYYKKIFLFKVRETWFDYQFRIADIFSLNVFMHLKDQHKKQFHGVKDISYTVELNLEQDQEIIFANFSNDVRRKIKKAATEGTICYFDDDIDGFVEFFNDFAIRKNTFTASKENMVALGDCVAMSFAENNGQILAAHSYLIDKNIGIVRGIHSGTRRLHDDGDKSLVGRAHKYLVVSDILHFKKMGFKVFDFGGYAKDTQDVSMKGINSFKLFFGGKIVTCINYYSYGYWFLKKISKLIGTTGKL